MNNLMQTALCLALTLGAGAKMTLAAPQAPPGLTLTIEMVKGPGTSADKPIILALVVTNASKHDSGFSEQGYVTHGFQLSVKNEQGASVPLTRYGQEFSEPLDARRPASLIYFVPLPAGKTLRFYVWLNHLYDMTQTGSYTVSAKRKIPADGKSEVTLTSNLCPVFVYSTTDDEVIEEVLHSKYWSY